MRPVLFYFSFSARLGRKSRRKLDYFNWKAWPRPMFTALSDYLSSWCTTCKHPICHPEDMYKATKLSGNCCFLNFIIRMLSVWWLTRLTVILIGKYIIPKCEMFCDLKSIWRFAALLSFLLPSISFYVLLSCILQRNDKHLE